MRLAILADIHGNVLALEAVLTDLEHRRVDEVVNLGDCVSGPLWPRETAQLLMRLDWRTVRGNHDRWVTDWLPEQARLQSVGLQEHVGCESPCRAPDVPRNGR
jgi:predicted phosphodiesterase